MLDDERGLGNVGGNGVGNALDLVLAEVEDFEAREGRQHVGMLQVRLEVLPWGDEMEIGGGGGEEGRDTERDRKKRVHIKRRQKEGNGRESRAGQGWKSAARRISEKIGTKQMKLEKI